MPPARDDNPTGSDASDVRATPAWWSRRDRVAARLGEYFPLAFYIASRRTRDRWATVAHLLEISASSGSDEQAVIVARHLESEGVLPLGASDWLAARFAEIAAEDQAPWN